MSSKVFKAGDRVTLKSTLQHQYPRVYGQTLTVSSAPNEVEGAIYLDEVSLIDGWFRDSWFVAIEEIRAGDWVYYTGTKHKLEKDKAYQIGAVISGHAYPEPLYVLRGPEVWVPRNEVTFVSRVEAPPVTAKEFIAAARTAGADSLGIANDSESCDVLNKLAEPVFKKGDWVLCIRDDLQFSDKEVQKGARYKVTSCDEGFVYLQGKAHPHYVNRFVACETPTGGCCGGEACGTTLRRAIEAAATPGPTGGTTVVCKGCADCAPSSHEKARTDDIIRIIDPRFEKGDWVECIEEAENPALEKGAKYKVVNVWDMDWKPFGARPTIQVVTADNKNTVSLARRFRKCDPPKPLEKKEWLVVPERGIALSKSTGFDNKEDALGFAGRLDTPSSVYEEVFRVEPQPTPSAKVTKVD